LSNSEVKLLASFIVLKLPITFYMSTTGCWRSCISSSETIDVFLLAFISSSVGHVYSAANRPGLFSI